MKKLIIRYGLYSGLLSAALMFGTGLYLNQVKSFEHSEIYGYVGILLSMIFVFLGVWAYRDQEGSGTLSFGKAIQVGFLISLISCVFYVISWILVYKMMMPDFMDRYMEYFVSQLRADGTSEEILKQKMAEMDTYKHMYDNPLLMAAMTFIEPLPIALLVTLVSAVFLRKK